MFQRVFFRLIICISVSLYFLTQTKDHWSEWLTQTKDHWSEWGGGWDGGHWAKRFFSFLTLVQQTFYVQYSPRCRYIIHHIILSDTEVQKNILCCSGSHKDSGSPWWDLNLSLCVLNNHSIFCASESLYKTWMTPKVQYNCIFKKLPWNKQTNKTQKIFI